MAYVDRLVLSLLWVSQSVIIGYVILRSYLKVHELNIIWVYRNNTNLFAVLEMWVSEVGECNKISN